MRFSIFTPTHNPRYLDELFASLLMQSCNDWEWVLSPNNGAVIPSHIAAHPQVRVLDNAPETDSIGAQKLYACDNCIGDYLIEVDHDDILNYAALTAISVAIDSNPAADVLYSDFADVLADGSCQIYSDAHGWAHYAINVNGRDVIAMRAMPVSPLSLSRIWFAPNHIRVIKRTTYRWSGGHNPNLAVCDDHDLLCRLYIDGAKFHHIPQCLYLYRIQSSAGNTYLQRNADIQRLQLQIGDYYMPDMMRRFVADHGAKMSGVKWGDA